VDSGKTIGALCLFALCLSISCAESAEMASVDATWNLTCPIDSAVGCGSLAEDTCLGDAGQRTIAGERGSTACDGEPLVASCEAIERSNGTRVIFLEASIGSDFAFELRGATVDAGDGSVEASACTVTIVEDGLPYDVGSCGTEPPSMEQPCQLSDVSTDGGDVEFDLLCRSLISSTTENGFDVGAVGGGPTTISFRNCDGF
jgi:hypothetical protein